MNLFCEFSPLCFVSPPCLQILIRKYQIYQKSLTPLSGFVHICKKEQYWKQTIVNFSFFLNINSFSPIILKVNLLHYLLIYYLSRFFDHWAHETMYAYIGKKHFFTKSCHCQTYQNSKISWQKICSILGIKVLQKLKLSKNANNKIFFNEKKN